MPAVLTKNDKIIVIILLKDNRFLDNKIIVIE